MTLKELRKEKGLTQAACAKVVGVPVRTYVRYETDEGRAGTLKYRYMLETLQKYGVKYAYLFGSYAKGKATERSDVDLLISMPLNGLRFYELVEVLRESLKKKVDLLDETQLDNNSVLVKEILRDGIKIYG